MYKVIVFAGTTEGYEISRFLGENQIPVLACVATEYGSRSLKESSSLHVQAGRLDENEMKELFFRKKPELVLDATHPYAAEVTRNIRKACEEAEVSYTRILRTGSEQQNAAYVKDTQEAAEYLKGTTGNVLLTTGSKELAAFTSVPDYKERLFARVLSLPSVIEACQALGFEGRNLIAMQGPFSMELNQAMLTQYECRYLVTKDSGKAGGFLEKIQAAEACGATVVIIGRPLAEEGLSLRECRHMLIERYGLTRKQKVTLLGIGMGSPKTLTLEGQEAVRNADLIVGAKRMVDAVRLSGQDVFYEYRSKEIAEYLIAHPEYTKVVVALSGDVGFYSGAKKLAELLGPDTEMICGISSVVYFMSKIGLSWDDAKIVSAHGKACNLISLIRMNRKVFSILGTGDGVRKLAEKLTFYGMGDVILHVGENLSYDNEKILAKPARELVSYEGDPLSVICAYNLGAEPELATHGIPDEEFIRGKAPMTKTEVRTVSLSKLRLPKDAICYDIGAGTGSVSVEMALRASEGEVYAIEKKEDALALLHENKKKFALDHMHIIPGTAPEAFEELPVPTHAFIGGSSGNMKEIVELLLNKNPQVRIVINCITLETVGEALACIRGLEKQEIYECESEVVQLCASRSKNIGRYHMMMGENPIYIITVQAHEKCRTQEEEA
nr:precorrin-6A reductase [uncultured Blautia sp.]